MQQMKALFQLTSLQYGQDGLAGNKASMAHATLEKGSQLLI